MRRRVTHIASRMMRLGDPGAPFKFKKGDRVAWRRFDGSPDGEFSGEVVDAHCEYHFGSGIYRTSYVVKRDNGYYFGADQLNLIHVLWGGRRDPAPAAVPPARMTGR